MSVTNGKHYLPSRLLNNPVRVAVIGAGGTGSHVACDLAVLHQSMRDLGHPHGLSVSVVDFDTVSSANVGRARFYASDVGQNKAQVLVNRINLCYGLDFQAVTGRVSSHADLFNMDIVIGCVDTRESRRAIWESRIGAGAYWLDIGNGADDGQVILGQFPGRSPRTVLSDDANQRLPTVVDLYPEMLDAGLDPKDTGPSCSRAEALRKQSAFVNKAAALHAVSMLSALFRDGSLDHHAVFFNVKSGRSSTLACDPAAWLRFGYGKPAVCEQGE